MMLTEEQAREKWCPFARVADKPDGPVAGANRWPGHAFANHSCCIASDCMAWWWGAKESPPVGAYPGKRGYCGLAGKPEAAE